MKHIILIVSIGAVVLGCSAGEVARVGRIVATGDVASAQRMAAEKAARYAANPKALERDIQRLQRETAKIVAAFRTTVGGEWGDREIKEPTSKENLKHTQNYLSRASVDFDRGKITVETLDAEDPLKSLKNAIVTTLLTPEDPRAVDLYSARTVELGEVPFLYGEVTDHRGQTIRWSWRAEVFADYLIENEVRSRRIEAGDVTKDVRSVVIGMVKDHHEVRALKYRPLVERFAKDFSVSKNLIYAIIKTESGFNPYAVSHAPAFGLMQVVPATAGQDVHRFLTNTDGIPSKELLLSPEGNIRYGTAYLHLLQGRYLKDIRDPASREYCVIASYNAGAGTVLRTFDPDRDRAPDRINRMPPLDVLAVLRTELPSDEGRRYLVKVMDAKRDFVNF